MNVRRVFVEKRPGFAIAARHLQADLADFLGGQYEELASLQGLRILNRYDVKGLNDAQFEEAVRAVLSEPQCDTVYLDTIAPDSPATGDCCFAVEYLPGQYNQRADSAEQCVHLITGVRPHIRCAAVYILQPGAIPISDAALEAVKTYLINTVDSQECAISSEIAPLEEVQPTPADVPTLPGFITASDAELTALAQKYALAMNLDDLRFCRDWFASIERAPTLAELKVLDTYWSDHCRHTTFTTVLERIEIGDGCLAPMLANALAMYEAARDEVYGTEYGEKAHYPPRSLMDMAVIGAKVLRKRGLASDVDVSKEVNACTVTVNAEFSDGTSEPWFLLFKNETHNHPTEIEPFGGAATCLGGAIRDPLAGRAFVHQAMRISGGGDPRVSLSETLPRKLPQLKIAREAATGYSSYGNQIGLATGQVAEFYHNGFLAKRMELGAVIAAVPQAWVRRKEPAPGDLVILVGGKTGRDGIGGATGSSKTHTGESVQSAGAEVQKGNAVEERKLQRLFRNPEAIRRIKRCNDFGAGGVSVAVGELAAGLDIDLDKVPKKYAGLDGIELAISESQERMAVVVCPADAPAFIALAAAENLDAVVIARITANDETAATNAALKMHWRGEPIVNLSRAFLNTNGASRSARALLPADKLMKIRKGKSPPSLQTANRLPLPPSAGDTPATPPSSIDQPKSPSPRALLSSLEEELSSLRSCSRRGLQEHFDGSIGSASALFPWGGSEQATPECGMAALLPSLDKQSRTASLLSFGYDPDLMEQNPYEGAKGSIREALAKIACLGGDFRTARLSLQEYFPRPQSPESWGLPAAALLGALEAQLALGIPAIGGKDSMSGNYRDAAAGIDLSVPPTLVAFAAGTTLAASVRSGALNGQAGNPVILLAQSPVQTAATIQSEWEVFQANMDALAKLGAIGCVRSAYPVAAGGIAVSLALMAFGNNVGLEAQASVLTSLAETLYQGSALVELDGKAFEENPRITDMLAKAGCWKLSAVTVNDPVFRITDCGRSSAEIPLATLRHAYEHPLTKVYPQTAIAPAEKSKPISHNFHTKTVRQKRSANANPLVLLPVFPGTNCEWDMERAFREAGARTKLVIFRNRNTEDILQSKQELAAAIAESHILALSGGFSAGDEPDGSGKFIANVLRSPAIVDAVSDLLENRDGLILGICNGFQALIKLGLVPYGRYRKADNNIASMPTLTFNRIGRHVSRMVRTRVMPTGSPWLALEKPGEVHVVPVSHGEGRLVISREEAQTLFANGQVPFCYADANGQPALHEPDNPNGSDYAIEGLCSPDGRILGKMGHSERRGEYVHVNIPGNKRQNIFEAGVRYFA